MPTYTTPEEKARFLTEMTMEELEGFAGDLEDEVAGYAMSESGGEARSDLELFRTEIARRTTIPN